MLHNTRQLVSITKSAIDYSDVHETNFLDYLVFFFMTPLALVLTAYFIIAQNKSHIKNFLLKEHKGMLLTMIVYTSLEIILSSIDVIKMVTKTYT